MQVRFISSAFAALVALSVSAASAGTPGRSIIIDVHQPVSQAVDGPASVYITGANPIRVSWTVNMTQSPIAGITAADLASLVKPFSPVVIPAAGATGVCAHAPTNESEARDCENAARLDVFRYNQNVFLANQYVVGVTQRIDKLIEVDSYGKSFTTVDQFTTYQKHVDSCIFGDGACTVQGVSLRPTLGDISPIRVSGSGSPRTFPDASASKPDVDALAASLGAGPLQQLHTAVSAQLKSLTASANALKPGSSKDKLTSDLAQDVADLKAAEDSYQTFVTNYAKGIQPLNRQQFYFQAGPIMCKTMFQTGLSTKYSVMVDGTDRADAVVNCRPAVYLSLSPFGFGGLDNRTYINVPPNTAGLPAPAAGATAPPGTIVATNTGSRYVFAGLLNWAAIPLDDQGSNLGLSIGVGTPTKNGGGAAADMLAGISLSFHRSIVFTYGRAFGSVTSLAPGYRLNGPIPANTTPPTVTGSANGWYAGVSFGFPGTSTNNPTPAPSATSSPAKKP